MVPAECPDNMGGCGVFHVKEKKAIHIKTFQYETQAIQFYDSLNKLHAYNQGVTFHIPNFVHVDSVKLYTLVK